MAPRTVSFAIADEAAEVCVALAWPPTGRCQSQAFVGKVVTEIMFIDSKSAIADVRSILLVGLMPGGGKPLFKIL